MILILFILKFIFFINSISFSVSINFKKVFFFQFVDILFNICCRVNIELFSRTLFFSFRFESNTSDYFMQFLEEYKSHTSVFIKNDLLPCSNFVKKHFIGKFEYCCVFLLITYYCGLNAFMKLTFNIHSQF